MRMELLDLPPLIWFFQGVASVLVLPYWPGNQFWPLKPNCYDKLYFKNLAIQTLKLN